MSSTLIHCTSQTKVKQIIKNYLNVILNNNPDLYQINLENESIKIKTIREIKEKIIYPPSREEFKTFILYNFEKTTIPAQNAFLKTLEEHPSYIQYILQCNTLSGVLETIKSRCVIKSCVGGKKQEIGLTFEQVEELRDQWSIIADGSFADMIDLCAKYKDREEALKFIRKLITFIHQENQANPTILLTSGLQVLSTSVRQLKQNSNVLLTLEHHFFEINELI